jgi:hypothetical protein
MLPFVMKRCLVLLLFFGTACMAQGWELELMAGTSRYKGDLTQSHFELRTMRPATAVNLKYNIANDFVVRAGIAWGQVTGNDKYNKQADLRARNLNFRTNIFEVSLVAEYNLLEPEIFYAYPYIFGGAGIFHFNPYTYDNNNKKTFLRPLSTEGQGLAAYPDRKPYSKTQFCLPFGAGWKWSFSKKYELSYEIGYRILFTDYLDDVSKTYVDPALLLAARGPKAVELAIRSKNPMGAGDVRGHSNRDWYFFSGIKLMMRLQK